MNSPAASNDIFRWSDGFNIGLREIDDQHERLVAMLNRLARHHTSKTADDDLLRVFDELVSYTAYHFQTEDRVMTEAAVDARHAEVHRRAHQDFVEQGARRTSRCRPSSPREVTGDTLVFLTNWLIHHILGMDRQLGVEVRRAQQRDGLAVTVELPPDGERTTEVLLHAVDGLYEQLGRNTADLRETNARLQQELARSKQAALDLRIAATAFEAQESIIITDATSRILQVNKAFCATTGYAGEEVVGRNPRLLSSGRQDAAFYAEMWRSIHASGSWQGEIWNRRKNGEAYPSWLSITAVLGEDGQCPAISSAPRPTSRRANWPRTGSRTWPITTS
jgi:hemerythrin-like metal-binding protein/PAS domain S-box-containing protein